MADGLACGIVVRARQQEIVLCRQLDGAPVSLTLPSSRTGGLIGVSRRFRAVGGLCALGGTPAEPPEGEYIRTVRRFC